MDQNSAKRVDSIYRNIKQLPLLGCLGVFVPFIGVLLLPIAITYSILLSRLLRDCDNGNPAVEDHDRIPSRLGDVSTEQKLDFLRYGNTRLWIPYIVGLMLWLPLIAVLIAFALQ